MTPETPEQYAIRAVLSEIDYKPAFFVVRESAPVGSRVERVEIRSCIVDKAKSPEGKNPDSLQVKLFRIPGNEDDGFLSIRMDRARQFFGRRLPSRVVSRLGCKVDIRNNRIIPGTIESNLVAAMDIKDQLRDRSLDVGEGEKLQEVVKRENCGPMVLALVRLAKNESF